MADDARCLKCGAPLTSDARDGVCPKCLLEQALAGPWDESVPVPGTKVRYFGDYELLEEIAHGGMGVVYRVRQVSLNRVVALKLIRAGILASEAEVKRFRLEAEAAAKLQHPNIVAVHEVGEHEGQQFFSMDLVAGPSLERLVRENPLAPRRAAAYLQKIAEAIHYAHEHGVLHRDLKPGNVLVDPNDEPHVTDFGLAKLVHSDDTFTRSGTVMGSLSYMPPEQAEGRSRDVDARSDVYGLGATLYELLTGHPPFKAETAALTMKLILETEPVPPRLMNPRLPLDLETVCLKCLAKERSRRYQTAQELAEELGRFLRDEPIRARPTRAPEKLWRWCRRKPAVAALSASLAVALALVAVVAVFYAMRERAHSLRLQQSLAQQHLRRGQGRPPGEHGAAGSYSREPGLLGPTGKRAGRAGGRWVWVPHDGARGRWNSRCRRAPRRWQGDSVVREDWPARRAGTAAQTSRPLFGGDTRWKAGGDP